MYYIIVSACTNHFIHSSKFQLANTISKGILWETISLKLHRSVAIQGIIICKP